MIREDLIVLSFREHHLPLNHFGAFLVKECVQESGW